MTAPEFLDIVKRLESINAIDTKLVILYQNLVQGMNS